MRRKQLYAMILAGALAAGGVPVTAMAADTAAEEAGDLGSGENTEESAKEEQPAEESKEPTEAPAEQPTEAPAESSPTEAPAEPAQEEKQETETPAETTEEDKEPAEASAEEPTDTGIAINEVDADGNVTPKYYNSLQEAIDAAEDATAESSATVIEVSKPIALSSTVTVSGRKIAISAVGDISIARETDSFTGDMFKVSGENSSLSFEAKDGGSLTVSGAFTDAAVTADGSIVNVSGSGSFGLFPNVVLSGNISSADGAAVNCTGGQIALAGGTITGNTGAKGAVYSDSAIRVQGTVTVKDNKIGDAQANVYLDGTAEFVITDELTGSDISFTHAGAAEGTEVLAVAENVAIADFKAVAGQFSYETEEYILNPDTETNKATLKKKATEPSVEPTVTVTVTPTPTTTTKPTETPTKTPSFLTEKKNSLKWINRTTVSVEISNTQACKWYYTYVDSGTSEAEIEKMYDAKHSTKSVAANKGFTVTATNVPEKNDKWLVVFATSTAGKTDMKYFKLDEVNFNKKRPSFLTYQSGSLKWDNHTTVSLQMSTTLHCKWYSFFVDAGTDTKVIQNMYDASRATNEVGANKSFTVTAENVPEADTWLVVCAKPDSGKAKMSIFKLNTASFKKKRPAAATTSTRPARTYAVTQSTITGLENPLKFTPGTFYEFSVTGAGQNDEKPYVSGDERWIPMYWSLSENPTKSGEKNTTFRIGSPKGIADAKTYNIYVFFKKQVYNGAEWQDTDVIESVKTQFSSQKLSPEDLTVTPTGEAGDNGSGGGGDGSGSGDETDAELTATEAASEKDGGSSSKSAVSTLDESPIGAMVALAALSLLAGGYILIRKRKKDI